MSACLPKKALVLEVKQGDTMTLGCSALDVAGLAVSLVGIAIRAQMRSLDDNALIAELEVEPVNLTLGTYELWYPGDGRVTAAPSDYRIDIEYSEPSGTRTIARSSRTFYVRVLQGVTADEVAE